MALLMMVLFYGRHRKPKRTPEVYHREVHRI